MIYNPYHSSITSGIFNTQTIKSADLLVGGFGAEYGGRNSSIMYITTKDGNSSELHGENGYQKLYKMLFDRLVNYHQINNMIWVFNGNELREGVAPYENFFPGHDCVDILATDVYRNNYGQKDYDELLKLAQGKPIALGEVAKMPSPENLQQQPEWVWFMTWVELVFISNTYDELKIIYDAENTLNREDIRLQ
ncbi:hypothetical protein ES705_13920 [subsurface metagenome]